ncbi:hypothetical protein O77CONTIG1_03764 [Leptolyngbya sp. O-77]|nr:hypothetical protein O77CONTIG1_03764 [Leptolyngbya sp. O-77]
MPPPGNYNWAMTIGTLAEGREFRAKKELKVEATHLILIPINSCIRRKLLEALQTLD